ncbi:putative pre-mRNA polyadenylation factor Fip1 domain-containing protein [Helianthus annuus]|nr:putative pre-mRNA polyadenylation factor Fip1 domain-containing protein [Helianthus annuus]KAJ0531442.1 putative pre-mRNA polyadenylation factor Fip1 domain-containing protein [Helianthus annuus]KAJ0698285.1 putative pre-mRNA polyadenylation factor Fip1 domain-containing protein [Helianthus annuus]
MEDDDEFGDLYTDVLQPLQTTSSAPPLQSPPVRSSDRIPSDDEEILYGSKSSNSLKLGQSDLNSNLNLNLSNNNRDIAAVKTDSGVRVLGKLEEKVIEQDLNLVHGGNNNNNDNNNTKEEENFGIEEGGEEDEFMIPGLSSSGARVLEQGGDDNNDWDDSDSEDDLQIVLNDDNTVGMNMMGMDGGGGLDGGDDDGGDDLVIVTGDVAQKMGYGGHGYHPFHSQFKYVRPGAAPMPGAGPVATGGAPGQVRPPGSMLSFAGRGRGEWHPAGAKNVPPNMQKNFHPGWNNNGAGRGFGSGLDFTLPSHKTIFEVDIDGFEEKPWRLQGIDISDFFNFGMNEETWKEYCKQLEQHRLEATMQSKIRVYESGRAEQEYDPDLPPELAAAAGHDISSENRNFGKVDVQSDLAKGSVRSRMQLPTGKAIQVETGFGERLPSIDTRPPRIRDSDAIIEIVLQRSPSPDPEPIPKDDVAEHLEDDKKENLENEDEVGSEADRFDKPHGYNNGRKREVSGKRGPVVGSVHEVAVTGDRVPHFSETEVEDHLDSRNRTSSYPSKKNNSSHNHIDRQMKRTAASRSPRFTDIQNEESTESVDHKQSHSSSPVTLGSADDRSFDQNDANKDVVTAENTTDKDSLKDEKSRHKMKKHKVINQAEHFFVDRGEDREDSIISIHSGNVRKPMKEHRGRDEKQERHQMAMKGMEDQYSHRKWESNQGYRSQPKSENYDRKKGREPEGVWLDDMRKRSHKARENERSDKNEYRSRKQLDMMPVLTRDEGLKTQTRHHTVPEGMQSKREESLHSHRESNSRRKRERDDSLQREKVERQREREKDKSWVGYTKLKEDSRSFKETGWDPISRREKFENETVSRHRGRELRDDVYAHGNNNKINNEERISSRHERGYSGSAKDVYGVQEKKHKETLKKVKETDAAVHNSLATSRRNREDHVSQKSDRVSSRGNIEQRASDQNPATRKSSKKHKEKEYASSEDEQSKKGRSKLERWTSHKDVDFSLDIKETDVKYKDNDPPTNLPEEPIKPQETLEKSKSLVEEKNEDAKPPEDKDKHLDTVEKLKKRSERFKLPMPSEKEALAIKRIENEPLPSAQPETQPESDVKPERPARKRRWTSG